MKIQEEKHTNQYFLKKDPTIKVELYNEGKPAFRWVLVLPGQVATFLSLIFLIYKSETITVETPSWNFFENERRIAGKKI
jgi:hypothetical protein